MATIEERKSGASTRYRVRIRVKGHPSRTKTFKRKTDATAWAKQVEADLSRGMYVATNEAMRRTVAEMVDKYIEEVLPIKKHNKDRAKVEAVLKWWKGEIGGYSLANATPAVIADAKAKLLKGNTRRGTIRSPATVNRYLAALAHAYRYAAKEWHWIQVSPMPNVSRCSESKGRVRFLSDKERHALLRECKASPNPYLYAIVVLALSTGARRGEILSLHWRDVDLARGLATLHDTKNTETRALPLAGLALKILKGLDKVRRIDTDLVFPGPRSGKPCDFENSWKAALERAGIEDYRFHDNRHSAASYLAANGATLAEIGEILGHKTLAMVKRYSHLTTGHTSKVVERMNREIFR